MKKLLLSIIIILILCGNIYADVYVLFNSETKDVQDISPDNSAVVEAGFEKVILPGILEDYPLIENPQYYKFINNRFVLNSDKINAEIAEQNIANEIKAEREAIRKQMEKTAYEDLKKDGVVFKHIKDADFQTKEK